ncbi:MAG: DUF2953 domain-containing protein [Ruminococcaceae bacterium]|nr:DUF2953 domain-containing protein [Oscillospiraceae bacterium]
MNPFLLILAILGGILGLILLLILFGSVKIRVIFKKKLRVVLYAFGIPITLVSDKPKKKDLPPELKNCKNPEAVLRREKKKYLKAQKKAAEKQAKQKLKNAEKAKRKKQHQSKEAKKKDPSMPKLSEKIAFVFALLKALYRATNGKFRLRVYRMHLLIGTDDAAKTAILYGATVQSVSYILQWLQTHFIPIRRDEGDMTIDPDFVRGKTSVDIDICCSLKLRRGMIIGVRMLWAYLKEKEALDQTVKKRLEEAQKELSDTQAQETTTSTT